MGDKRKKLVTRQEKKRGGKCLDGGEKRGSLNSRNKYFGCGFDTQ